MQAGRAKEAPVDACDWRRLLFVATQCCILQVATKVDEGVKQLVQAEKTQKQSRTILCIVFLLVAVIFMLFIVVFKAIFF